jgi:hypothetical protein
MTVNIDQRRTIRFFVHDMVAPEFFVKGFLRHVPGSESGKAANYGMFYGEAGRDKNSWV